MKTPYFFKIFTEIVIFSVIFLFISNVSFALVVDINSRFNINFGKINEHLPVTFNTEAGESGTTGAGLSGTGEADPIPECALWGPKFYLWNELIDLDLGDMLNDNITYFNMGYMLYMVHKKIPSYTSWYTSFQVGTIGVGDTWNNNFLKNVLNLEIDEENKGLYELEEQNSGAIYSARRVEAIMLLLNSRFAIERFTGAGDFMLHVYDRTLPQEEYFAQKRYLQKKVYEARQHLCEGSDDVILYDLSSDSDNPYKYGGIPQMVTIPRKSIKSSYSTTKYFLGQIVTKGRSLIQQIEAEREEALRKEEEIFSQGKQPSEDLIQYIDTLESMEDDLNSLLLNLDENAPDASVQVSNLTYQTLMEDAGLSDAIRDLSDTNIDLIHNLAVKELSAFTNMLKTTIEEKKQLFSSTLSAYTLNEHINAQFGGEISSLDDQFSQISLQLRGAELFCRQFLYYLPNFENWGIDFLPNLKEGINDITEVPGVEYIEFPKDSLKFNLVIKKENSPEILEKLGIPKSYQSAIVEYYLIIPTGSVKITYTDGTEEEFTLPEPGDIEEQIDKYAVAINVTGLISDDTNGRTLETYHITNLVPDEDFKTKFSYLRTERVLNIEEGSYQVKLFKPTGEFVAGMRRDFLNKEGYLLAYVMSFYDNEENMKVAPDISLCFPDASEFAGLSSPPGECPFSQPINNGNIAAVVYGITEENPEGDYNEWGYYWVYEPFYYSLVFEKSLDVSY